MMIGRTRLDVGLSPNPLRSRATIHYAVPAPGRVQVRVFDVAGRSVVNLFDGIRPEGRYTVPFVRDGLASGIYFVRIETGTEVSTAKAVVLD